MSFTGSRSRLTEYCKATRHVFGHAVQTYGAAIRSRHVVQTCASDINIPDIQSYNLHSILELFLIALLTRLVSIVLYLLIIIISCHQTLYLLMDFDNIIFREINITLECKFYSPMNLTCNNQIYILNYFCTS